MTKHDDYEYRCEAGHWCAAYHPLTVCPIHGCMAALQQVRGPRPKPLDDEA